MARDVKRVDEPGQGGPEDLQALMQSNGENVEAFTKATQAVMEGFAELNQEVMTFGQRRFQENVERSKALMECKTLEDAFRVQCNFIQSASQQYMAESNNLFGLMTKITTSSWMPMEERTRKALHEIATD